MKSPMKTVIQVVQHLCPGGIETMALDLATFCEQDEKTFIISLEGNLENAITAWPRLEPFKDQLIFLDKEPGLRPSLVLRLKRLLKNLNADVVHTHHIGPLLYAGLAARLAGIKCLIHTEHDAWHLDNARRRKLARWAVKLLRPLLVADADTVATSMKKHLQCDDIRIIRNGIDTERFIPGDKTRARQHLGLPEDALIIGCSGRLEKVKGQEVLINAMAWLPNDVHLALAGAGSTETALRKQAKYIGIESRIHFLGRIDEMPGFYQALDVFCLPSLNEGLPLSPLEAQACNIPAVVTDVGGAHETLCPLSGKLTPKGDAQTMADNLSTMLDRSCDHSPRRFVQQHGDVHLMASAYAKLRYAGE